MWGLCSAISSRSCYNKPNSLSVSQSHTSTLQLIPPPTHPADKQCETNALPAARHLYPCLYPCLSAWRGSPNTMIGQLSGHTPFRTQTKRLCVKGSSQCAFQSKSIMPSAEKECELLGWAMALGCLSCTFITCRVVTGEGRSTTGRLSGGRKTQYQDFKNLKTERCESDLSPQTLHSHTCEPVSDGYSSTLHHSIYVY